MLPWVNNLAIPGSLLIFDDWNFSSSEPEPENFGEQRAFCEWVNRFQWEPLVGTEEANVAFVKII